MDILIALILLAVVLAICVLPVVAIIWAVQAKSRSATLERRLLGVEEEIRLLRRARESEEEASSAQQPSETVTDKPLRERQAPAAPPPAKTVSIESAVAAESQAAAPPLLQPPPPPPQAPAPATPPKPALELPALKGPFNWEQFMGVKLFAWVGGLALFFAVVFFVKYSFAHNLIPPEVRVVLGFVAGISLLVGGVVLKRKDYRVTSQTLVSTGILILYASTFAAHGFYRFALFGVIPTFLLMTLITATAFVLAVNLNAMVVAVLGMLGGFLTPVLLSTGVDNPFGLFSYIALLDAGLLAVALHRRWYFLAGLAAVGTVFMQLGWTAEFFKPELYHEGNKVLIPMVVLTGFGGLYLAATDWARRREQSNLWFSGSTLLLLGVALCYTGFFLAFSELGERPALLFSYMFLVNLGVLALGLFDKRLSFAQPLSGIIAFLLLAAWTTVYLIESLLQVALLAYLVFALLHAVTPVVLNKLRPGATVLWGVQGFPPLTLLLVLIPILQLTELSFLVWPFVLLVDVLAIALAILTVSIWPLLVMMLFTLLVTGASLTKIPLTFDGFPLWLTVLGFFSVLFVGVGAYLARRLQGAPVPGPESDSSWSGVNRQKMMAAQLSATSAALPFLLLIMAIAQLPLQNPSSVFGVALLFVVLLFGIARWLHLRWMCAVGLGFTVALEVVWHFTRFNPESAMTSLIWYIGFFAVFAAHPFLTPRDFVNRLEPWIVSALSGPLHFFLIHDLVAEAYPNNFMGLVPALFAVPAVVGLILVSTRIPDDSSNRTPILAWFGGVALFFITLIFPIQFERQWITVGWALEGVALLWLFHRIPHRGLKWTGTGLLIAAFVRLAFNPAVLEYHARTETPLLNWYLYAYGVVAICFFLGARLLAAPRNRIGVISVPPVFVTLGTILAFLLVNIEIADYFTADGSRSLTFKFSGNFARDMTYTIAWALFAFGLLVVGILRRWPAARWSAMGLLGATILKLFLHDLAQLEALYRVGAFVVVALIAIGASVIYQRFFAGAAKAAESSPGE